MSILPKIDLPTYNIFLPISKIKVTFRPYLAKEHKLLLMAMESKDQESITNTLYQIINNCTLTVLDIKSLAIADIEFLFYNLRARSENELVNLKFKCSAKTEENVPCNNITPIELNLLTDLSEETIINKDIQKTIDLGNNTGVILNYINFLDKELSDDCSPDQIFEYFTDHIDSIYDENTVYSSTEYPKSYFIQFLEELPIKEFGRIEHFFSNQPTIIKSLNISCKKCGTNHNVKIEDIFNFLA